MTTRTIKKTTKPATKAAAPVVTETLKGFAERAGLNAAGAESAKAACNEACQALHKAKAKIGQAKTCALAQAFLAKRFAGKKPAASTKANALSAFRKAVESGKPYTENGVREAKAKAKGAKAGGGTIMIAIGSGAKAGDAAAKLRNGFNKMKEASDDLAKVAAFLIDALDEAGYEAEAE
jgi:hypothetical protein